MEKKLDHILQGRKKNIGAETVIQPLPHKDFRFASPFIVLHHLLPHYYPLCGCGAMRSAVEAGG